MNIVEDELLDRLNDFRNDELGKYNWTNKKGEVLVNAIEDVLEHSSYVRKYERAVSNYNCNTQFVAFAWTDISNELHLCVWEYINN